MIDSELVRSSGLNDIPTVGKSKLLFNGAVKLFSDFFYLERSLPEGEFRECQL